MDKKNKISLGKISGAAALVLLLSGQTFAALSLKQVQVSAVADGMSGSQVDLLFDNKVNKSQIHTEFINDIVQVSLDDTAVYPAKIQSVNGSVITKIFAYQYTPKLVRCRFTVKGKAEDYRNNVRVIPNGKILTVRFDGVVPEMARLDKVSDKIALKAAAPLANSNGASGSFQTSKPAAVAVEDPEEKKLLEKVLASEATAQKPVVKTAADENNENKLLTKTEVPAVANVLTENKEATVNLGAPGISQKPLTGGRPIASPMKVMGKLFLVVGIMALLALVARKFLKNNSALGKLARSMTQKHRMVEVLANHSLGQKKNIAVVRISGKTLVLGVTNESINLITRLDEQVEVDEDVNELVSDLGITIEKKTKHVNAATAAKVALLNNNVATPESSTNNPFDKMLMDEAAKPAAYTTISKPAQAKSATAVNVRSQIKSKLEGMKQL